MSNLKDFSKMLKNFETEINQLQQLNDFYKDLQGVMQSQLDLAKKVEANNHLLNELLEKQKASETPSLEKQVNRDFQDFKEQLLEQQKKAYEDINFRLKTMSKILTWKNKKLH